MGLGFAERAAIRVVKQGPVPDHLAIIMDGNRRYAARHNLPRYAGHHDGGEKLLQCMEWCFHLGVRILTVFAFSIENFKRSSDEVRAIMALALEKLDLLCKNKEMIERHSLQIRILGQINLLPNDVQEKVRDVMNLTSNNTGPVVNVCLAYTGRDDITHSVRTLASAVSANTCSVSEITPDKLQSELYTKECGPVSLLLRTSGEIRLSDFLQWQVQSKDCVMVFTRVLWPELSFWRFLLLIIQYQSVLIRHGTEV